MWIPTKLDILFYVFSIIYYDFLKIQRKQIKKIKDKTTPLQQNRDAKPPWVLNVGFCKGKGVRNPLL
jgi:hypothetical protein